MQQTRAISPMRSMRRQPATPQPRPQLTADIKQIQKQQLEYAGIQQKQLSSLQAQFQRQRQEGASPSPDLGQSKQSIALSQVDTVGVSVSLNKQGVEGKDYYLLYNELRDELERYMCEMHACKDRLYDADTRLQGYGAFMEDLVLAVRVDPKQRQNQHELLFKPVLDRVLELQREGAEQREQMRRQQARLDEQAREFDEYNAKLRGLREEYQRFRQQVYVQRQREAAAQRELGASVVLREDQALQRRAAAQQERLEELQAEAARLAERLGDALRRADAADGLRAENAVLADKLADLLALDNNKQYIEGLVKELAAHQKTIGQQRDRIAALEKQVALQRLENGAAKEQLVLFQQESYKQLTELQRLKKEEQMFMQQLSVSRGSLRLKEEEIQEILNTQNQKIDAVKQKYEKQLVDAAKIAEREKRDEKEELEDVINALRDDRRALFKKLLSQTHSSQISAMKDTYMRLEEATGQIYRQLDEMAEKQRKQQEDLNITVQDG